MRIRPWRQFDDKTPRRRYAISANRGIAAQLQRPYAPRQLQHRAGREGITRNTILQQILRVNRRAFNRSIPDRDGVRQRMRRLFRSGHPGA